MAQVSLNTRISPSLNDRLTEFSKLSGRSKAQIIEKSLKEYLDREEAKFKKNEK